MREKKKKKTQNNCSKEGKIFLMLFLLHLRHYVACHIAHCYLSIQTGKECRKAVHYLFRMFRRGGFQLLIQEKLDFISYTDYRII